MNILNQLLLLALLVHQLLFLTPPVCVAFVGFCYVKAVMRVIQQAEIRVAVGEKPDGWVGPKNSTLLLIDVTPHYGGDRASHETNPPRLPSGGRVQEEPEGVCVQVPIQLTLDLLGVPLLCQDLNVALVDVMRIILR